MKYNIVKVSRKILQGVLKDKSDRRLVFLQKHKNGMYTKVTIT